MKTPNKPWEKGVVTSEIDSRSYEVQTESGGTYRRNRRHLRKSQETDFRGFESDEFQVDIPIPTQNKDSVPVAVNNNSAPISDHPIPTTNPTTKPYTNNQSGNPNYVMRSGREVKQPVAIYCILYIRSYWPCQT
jgi:hypothetical protein